jgi:voltage-gated potassium channel
MPAPQALTVPLPPKSTEDALKPPAEMKAGAAPARQLKSPSTLLLALSILITSCLMYFAEHALQPDKLGTIPDAMWWSIVTITTVGYGDVTPVSNWGKVIGAFTALSGVFTVALLTGIVASAFATRVRTHELEFTTEVEELLKDGQVDAKERRTIEHLRREFSITEEHARAIIRQILEEKTLMRPQDAKP